MRERIFHTAPDGRIVRAPRGKAPKTGWHVSTAAEIAAAEAAENARQVKGGKADAPAPALSKKGG